MTKDTISLPAIIPRSNRERRYEIRNLRRRMVALPVVNLNKYKNLKIIEDSLTQKIKLEEKAKVKETPKEPA